MSIQFLVKHFRCALMCITMKLENWIFFTPGEHHRANQILDKRANHLSHESRKYSTAFLVDRPLRNSKKPSRSFPPHRLFCTVVTLLLIERKQWLRSVNFIALCAGVSHKTGLVDHYKYADNDNDKIGQHFNKQALRPIELLDNSMFV